MGAPSTSIAASDGQVAVDVDPLAQAPAIDSDPLAEIGALLAALKARDVESAEDAAHILEGRQTFLDEFHAVCEVQVRPAMEAVLERLNHEGGGGLIEEHPGGEPRVSTPRLTLWMSLQGPVDGEPRIDRNPFLQLDADVAGRAIRLTEGDSWHGTGSGHSGRAGTWEPADVTRSLVVDELVEIVRRAARVSPA